jgi:hypothetical protein
MDSTIPPSTEQHGSTPHTQPTIPVQPQPTTTAGGEVGRRALLLSMAVVAGAVATPFALEKGAELAADEIRSLLRHELGDLEGIALDEAIAAAELTRKAVELIVIPLARFLATTSGDGLQVLADTIAHAEAALEFLHLPTDGLPALAALLTTWRNNEAQLPIALKRFTDADITGAETYLKGVKAKVDGSAPI